jgi:hypothetical protein
MLFISQKAHEFNIYLHYAEVNVNVDNKRHIDGIIIDAGFYLSQPSRLNAIRNAPRGRKVGEILAELDAAELNAVKSLEDNQDL